VLGPGVGCAVDLQVFAVLSSTGWRLSVRDLRRLAVAGYLLLLLIVVALAATVLPLLRGAVHGPGSEAKLLLAYVAANVYGLLAFAARESLTRRRALPCGAGRVDFLRAVDLPPEAV